MPLNFPSLPLTPEKEQKIVDPSEDPNVINFLDFSVSQNTRKKVEEQSPLEKLKRDIRGGVAKQRDTIDALADPFPYMVGLDYVLNQRAEEEQTKDFFERYQSYVNNPIYTNTQFGQDENIVQAKKGMMVKNGTTIEAEGGETLYHPNKGMKDIKGKSHEEGGVILKPTETTPGTTILSDDLIDPVTGLTFAKAIKKFDTSKEQKILNTINATQEEVSTAKLNMDYKNKAIASIIKRQQEMNGNQTTSVMKNGGIIEAAEGVVIPPITLYRGDKKSKWNAADKISDEQVAAIAKKYGFDSYYDPKSKDDVNTQFQKFLYEKVPGAKEKIDQLHSKDKGFGTPAVTGKMFDGKLGVRWQDALSTIDYSNPTAPVQNTTENNQVILPKDPATPVVNFTPPGLQDTFVKPQQTPYEIQQFGFDDALPFLANYASLKPYNYQTMDFTHWEMNPQEVNNRAGIEQLNKSFNAIKRTTTGNPSLQASRNATLYAQRVDAINQLMGNAQNKNAELRQGADQFNITARNRELELDTQAFSPIYNEYMAAAQDAVSQERSYQLGKLKESVDKHRQNETMIKMYDDILPHISLQNYEVTKDEKAKARFTNNSNI